MDYSLLSLLVLCVWRSLDGLFRRGLAGPKLSSEFLRLEARLDRISEQVDACLAEIVAGKPTTPTPAPKPVLQRQASSLSKASKASKGGQKLLQQPVGWRMIGSSVIHNSDNG